MKKKLSIFLSLMLMFSVFVPNFTVSAAGPNININGNPVAFTSDSGAPFVDSSNRTQVPLRVTMEAYGCDVDWSSSARVASVSKGGTLVEVPIGSNYIIVNGNQIANDTAAVIKDGRTYLPIRSVLEAFGASVNWNQTTQTVEVDSNSSIPNSSDLLKVHFIDVGQADAALIDIGEMEVLIDAGNNKDGKTVVNYIKSYVDGPLDIVIGTHPDADHIGGMDDVLEAYQVSKVIGSGDSSDSATYKDYWTAVQNEPSCEYLDDDNMTLDLGHGAALKIIECGDGFADVNDNSVVAELIYGQTKVLFTGDISETTELDNLNQFEDIDVLKVGHHGSSTSSSAKFLSVVKPEYAVISAGLDNRYGHPTESALKRLFDAGAKVLGTFKSGDITLTTDGKTYSFNKNNYLTLSDAGAKTVTQVTTPTPAPDPVVTNPTPSVTPTPSVITPDTTPVVTNMVWIPRTGTKYHTDSTCSGMKNPTQISKDAAIQKGYTPCKKCC